MDAFDAALDDAFNVGESIRKAKGAIKKKTWDANEDGETRMISGALNPPSLGQRESSVAKRSKRDWSWLYKALAAVLLGILVLIGSYYAIRAVKKGLGSEQVPPQLPPRDASFGTVAGAPDLYAEWVAYLLGVAARIKGTPSPMREAVDSVRADVLYGLAVRAGTGGSYETVAGNDLKRAVGVGYAAYSTEYYKQGGSPGLARLRSCIDGALVAIHHALPRSGLRSTLGDITQQAFGESWLNAPSDEARVYAIYALRDALSGGTQFGRPRGKCLFVTVADSGVADLSKTPCKGKCARDASVCESHKPQLPPGGTDLERLAAHLGGLPNPIGDKVRDMANKLEGMIAWPREGADAQTYDLMVAGLPAGTGFGSLGSFLMNPVTRAARGLGLVGPADTRDAAPTAGQPAAVVSEGGFIQLPTSARPDVGDPAEAWNAAEGWDSDVLLPDESRADADGDTFFDSDSFDSSARHESSATAADSGSEVPALVPITGRDSSLTEGDSAPNQGKMAGKIQGLVRMRSAKKRLQALRERKGLKEESKRLKVESKGLKEESKRSEESKRLESKRLARRTSPTTVARLARREQRRSERPAQFVTGEDFLASAHGFVKADTEDGRAMAGRFAERKRTRDALLVEVKKAPFVKELETFLYNVRIDPELRAQEATVALFWARRIVAFQADTKEGKASVALYELIRKNEEIVRREIALTSIPLTVKQAAALAEQDYKALRRAASTASASAHDELEGLFMRLRVAFHEEPVPSADGGDPIRIAYTALVARGKKALTERAGRENRDPQEARQSSARWARFVESMGGQWVSRKIVYEHAVPGERQSADLEVMIFAGMDNLALRAEEAKKTPSVADQIKIGKEAAAAFGSSSLSERIGKLAETDIGRSVSSALGVGTGGKFDVLLSAGATLTEMIALVKAITTAAKVGEHLIMQLLAFVVEGLRMLLKVMGGEKWAINQEIQTALEDVTVSSERLRELKAREAKTAAAFKELRPQLEKHKGEIQIELGTIRTFLDTIDGGSRAKDEDARAPSFGADETGGAVATDPASLGSVSAPVDTPGGLKPPGLFVKVGKLVEKRLSSAQKRAGDVYKGAGEGVQKLPNATLELIKKSPGFLLALVQGLWGAFREVFENGNILDLFGILVTKLHDVVAGFVSGTGGSSSGSGWFNWGLGVLAIVEVGTVDFEAYVGRVREWCMSPTTIRGLFTDPAGVLVGEANQSNRTLLEKHRAVAVPVVVVLFLLRLAQIVRAIFGTSLVTGLVCSMLGKMKKRLGDHETIKKYLGGTVDRIMTAVGCEVAPDDPESDEGQKLAEEVASLSATLTDLKSSIPRVMHAKTMEREAKEVEEKKKFDALQERLEASEAREAAAGKLRLASATPELGTPAASPPLDPSAPPSEPVAPTTFGRGYHGYRYGAL